MKKVIEKEFILITMCLLWLMIFLYVGYYLFDLINNQKTNYIEKKKEILTIEEKKKQSDNLKKTLNRVSSDAQVAEGALLGTDFDAIVDFIIRVEDIAKSLGVSHDITIASKAIDSIPSLERDLPKDSMLATFPYIVFGVKINGNYSRVIEFLEELNALPYYVDVGRLDITREELSESGEVQIESLIELKVFTRLIL